MININNNYLVLMSKSFSSIIDPVKDIILNQLSLSNDNRLPEAIVGCFQRDFNESCEVILTANLKDLDLIFIGRCLINEIDIFEKLLEGKHDCNFDKLIGIMSYNNIEMFKILFEKRRHRMCIDEILFEKVVKKEFNDIDIREHLQYCKSQNLTYTFWGLGIVITVMIEKNVGLSVIKAFLELIDYDNMYYNVSLYLRAKDDENGYGEFYPDNYAEIDDYFECLNLYNDEYLKFWIKMKNEYYWSFGGADVYIDCLSMGYKLGKKDNENK